MIRPQAYREIEMVAELRKARKKWRKAAKMAGVMRRQERERRIQCERLEEIPTARDKTGEQLLNYRMTTGLAPWGKENHLRPCWVYRGKEAEFVGFTLEDLVKATAVHGTKSDLYDVAYFIAACKLTNGQLKKRYERDEQQLLMAGGA